MKIVDASDRPNDENGYSVYALILIVPDPVASRVHAIRSTVKPRRAMIDAHVTALGTFCDIGDLETLGAKIASVVSGMPVLNLDPTGDILESPDGTSVAVTVEITPELQSLHDKLAESVLEVATNAYTDPSRYRAHMTFYQEIPQAAVENALRLARECELEMFTVDSVTLAGRVGTASSGEWRPIRQFPLS